MCYCIFITKVYVSLKLIWTSVSLNVLSFELEVCMAHYSDIVSKVNVWYLYAKCPQMIICLLILSTHSLFIQLHQIKQKYNNFSLKAFWSWISSFLFHISSVIICYWPFDTLKSWDRFVFVNIPTEGCHYGVRWWSMKVHQWPSGSAPVVPIRQRHSVKLARKQTKSWQLHLQSYVLRTKSSHNWGTCTCPGCIDYKFFWTFYGPALNMQIINVKLNFCHSFIYLPWFVTSDCVF